MKSADPGSAGQSFDDASGATQSATDAQAQSSSPAVQSWGGVSTFTGTGV